MTTFRHSRRVVFVLLACVAYGTPLACGQDQAAGSKEAAIWNSPKMRAIEADWQSLQDALQNAPEKFPGAPQNAAIGVTDSDKREHLEGMVDRLFRKRLSDEDLRQLAVAMAAAPNTPFAGRLAQFMAKTFIDLEDQKNLVNVLAVRCPARVAPCDTIEYYLVCRGTQLQDPVLILGDAFGKCQSPETRHQLAAAVRRSFAGLGVQGKDDAEYVQNAMQWYAAEKDHLAANRNYRDNDLIMPLERYEADSSLYDTWPNPLKQSDRQLMFEERRGPPKIAQPSAAETHPAYKPISEGPIAASASGGKLSPDQDWAKIEGDWEPIEVIEVGKQAPPQALNGLRCVFHDHTLVIRLPNGKAVVEARLRLDAGQDPRAIDLLTMPEYWPVKEEDASSLIYDLQQEVTSGIYELQGDTLRIRLPKKGSWIRPTEFLVPENSRESLFVLKRIDKNP